MKKTKRIIASCSLSAAVLACTLSFGFYKTHNRQVPSYRTKGGVPETSEEWFTDSATNEDFDFGLNEEWIDLNDLEYKVRDKLKTYLFIGTDHSGNENATDETYQGSMADFLLVAILNKTDHTYGFLQLNRDSITEVMVLDANGEPISSYDGQICTSHWYGASKQQSCLNTVDAVSGLLGDLTINGYYSIGMDEIAKLNHVIGGATVTIEDDFSRVDPSLVMGETITLTDEQAYNYLHARMEIEDGENESRMRRQRAYMEAVYDKVIDRVKSEKNFLKDITDSLGDSITTNMNSDDFGQIRETFQDGRDLGIHVPEGETTVGSRLDDGLEHTEFYVDEAALADIMVQLCDLKIDDFTDWNHLAAETETW